MWEKKKAMRLLLGENGRKRSLETPKYRLKNYTNTCFREAVAEDLDRIGLERIERNGRMS
jgi:hypothetical protein